MEKRTSFCIALGIGLILVFSTYSLFYKLGTEPFQDYDEATYAQVTHESLEEGSQSSLTFLHQPYFRKPPLLFWLTGASSRVFSDIEFADRFPSALAGLAAVAIVVLICLEAGASLPFALFGGAVLATTAAWVEFARDVRFDTLVSLFIVTSLYAAMRAARDARWFVVVGITLALAVLSKSVMAVFGGVAVLSYMLLRLGVSHTINLFKERHVWFGIGTFILVAAPWHIYESIQYGSAFWQSYLGSEVIARASMNLFPGSLNPTNTQYLAHLSMFGAPWVQLFVLSLLSLPFTGRYMEQDIRNALRAAVITVFAVLVVMFSAGTKAFGYLIPLYPFVAIVLALMAEIVWKRMRSASNISKGIFIALLMCTTLVAARHTRYDALHINPYYGWELGQAQEEHAIGEIIGAAEDPTVYTYNYDDLGSILYYSRLPDSAHPFVLVWTATSTPIANTFILATSSASLAAAFPQTHFIDIYSGTFVSLFTVAD